MQIMFPKQSLQNTKNKLLVYIFSIEINWDVQRQKTLVKEEPIKKKQIPPKEKNGSHFCTLTNSSTLSRRQSVPNSVLIQDGFFLLKVVPLFLKITVGTFIAMISIK